MMMPNHIQNDMFVYADTRDMLEEFRNYVGGYRQPYASDECVGEPGDFSPLSFNEIIPIPADILKAGYSKTGYHWQTKHWGTKWDAWDTEIYATKVMNDAWMMQYSFITAWSPPYKIYKELFAHFSHLTFECECKDEGSDNRIHISREKGVTTYSQFRHIQNALTAPL